MAPIYDHRVGQFRGADGRLVSRGEVLRLIDEERARMDTRMQGHMRLQIQGKISVEEFQVRMAYDLKLSSIRMASFAAGGIEQMTRSLYGRVGAFLKNQYKFLAKFGADIESGTYSEKQLMARSKLYGSASKTIFFETEKRVKATERFNQARRDLDPQSQHCEDCIKYETSWTDIDKVVAPGVNCSCRSRCRCRITYRRYNI